MASTINILLFSSVLFAAIASSTGINNWESRVQVPDEKKPESSEETLVKAHQEGKFPKGSWRRMHRNKDFRKTIETGTPLPNEYNEALAGSLGRLGQAPQAQTSSEKYMKNEKLRAPATSNIELPVSQHKKYCVPKPEVNDQVLQENIDWACRNGVDCDPLVNMHDISCGDKPLRTQAAYAMNYYYFVHGRKESTCDFNQTAILTLENPSTGKCYFL